MVVLYECSIRKDVLLLKIAAQDMLLLSEQSQYSVNDYRFL